MSHIPIDPETGLNPQVAKCEVCRTNSSNDLILLGKSRVAECRRCDAKSVYYTGRQPNKCENCGESGYRTFRDDRPYNPDKDGPLTSGMCERCEGWLEDANIIQCSGCNHIYQLKGVHQMLVGMDHEEMRKYALPDGSDFDFVRLVEDGKAKEIVGKVILQESCHYCNPNLPTPETPDGE